MTDAIRPCAGQDLDQILEVINDAAQAYDGVIPADRCQKPYMPLAELRLNPNLEDVYSNREAWVRARDEDAAGWLGAGRPRRACHAESSASPAWSVP